MFARSISALNTDLCAACIIFAQRNEIRFILVNQ
ncbi:hypothetical protein T12_12144 [Trichinella patagoniensis]|uniref:Uncharacterized protein n=1 Tax=Trichinella patagoniensis TaxID=990121 RepID=A0A0V0YTM7_9BILA|nr:hypothetical protein T12_12144 [Trichinella patagoniensis]